MIASLPPGLLLIFGAALVPLLRGGLRNAYLLALPLIGLADLAANGAGGWGALSLFDLRLAPVRADKLSLAFGYIFYIAAFLGFLFALNVSRAAEQVSALVYIGSAIGAVFAGDLVTLFVYWEITAIASVFIVWASRTERSYRAGMRYLVVQILSGVLLFAGAILHWSKTGSVAFGPMGLDGTAGALIFLAFGIKCAFPLLHNWLQDAYPESTVTGTVFLSAFTTKLAVYALARGFPGTEMLIWIGAAMAVFPIFHALIENNLRRVLAYSLNSQLGFMVVGIGIGSELALNGTVAHALASTLYQALLFMAVGAALFRTGTANATDLGGLFRSMPLTAAFCVVGGAAISAVPMLAGFVSKSLILSAAQDTGLAIAWMALLVGSVGALIHTGIKIPYLAFFGHDSGKRCAEAPGPMLAAMGLTAFLCIAIGVYPAPLYAILPYAVDYVPYTPAHVITQLQLLMFSALAFAVLTRTGLYPPELRSTNLDFDWFYRKAAPAFIGMVAAPLVFAWKGITGLATGAVFGVFARLGRSFREGYFAREHASGTMALVAIGGVALYLAVHIAFF